MGTDCIFQSAKSRLQWNLVTTFRSHGLFPIENVLGIPLNLMLSLNSGTNLILPQRPTLAPHSISEQEEEDKGEPKELYVPYERPGPPIE